VLKGALVAGLVWLVWRSRRQAWPASARRHFMFVLSVLFFLLWSPIVWEHYLALLFLPLIYVVAAHAHFSRPALATVAAIFGISVAQNLILINWVREQMAIDTLPEMVAASVVKSAPLVLTVVLIARHWRELFGSYAAAAWKRLESPGAR
jgi:hypothetical protein